MPLKIGFQPSELQQLILPKKSRFSPGGIQQGSGMSFREDEAIVSGVVRALRVVAHDREEQHRHDFCR
jgi:hypothetical protein